jgi:hypothetical protein
MVADGWARSGRQGQAVHAYRVAPPRALGQGHADARRVKHQGGSGWRARALRGKTRGWLGGEGRAPWALPLLRRRSARVRRWAARRPLWGCPEGLVSSSRAMRETGRAPGHTGTGGRPRLRPWRNVLSAQVVKGYERRRVVETERRRVHGTPARVETLRRRSPGDGVSHTADLERRHATGRAHLAPLARRCRALARHTLTRHEGMCLGGRVEHLCTPPARLAHPRKTTPARAAGSTDQGWTRPARRSLQVPSSRWAPPRRRGRPAQTLQRLIERWCS